MGAIYSTVTILVGLVATPILLHLLTPQRLGAAKAVGEWIGYLMLADLGIGAAAGVLLIRARKNSLEEAAAVTPFVLRLLWRVALVIVPLGVILAWCMPRLIRIDADMSRELQIAAAISAIGLFLMPLSVFRQVLETAQRGYLVNAALLAQSLTITSFSLLLAWMGWGLIGLALAGQVGGVLLAVLLALWGTRHLGQLRRVRTASIPLRRLWSLCWPLAAVGAGNRVNLMTDAIVVGYMLGPAPVAILFLTQRVIHLAAAQVNSINNASWAALSELLNSGRTDLFAARLAEMTRLIVGLGTVMVGSVAAYDGQFVRLWVGQNMYGGDLLAAATVASSVVFGFLCLFCWVIDMQGDTRRRLAISTTGSALNLVLSVLFVKKLGLVGVALGTLCAYLLTDAWYAPVLVCRRYGVPAKMIITSIARGLAAGIPWAAAVWMLARSHTPPLGWFGFALECCTIGLAALLYSWWLVFSASERSEWRRRLRRFRSGHAMS
jgi:O-antigen/teichoic acid export membrane protein